jgi:outer membrane protein OmpA-like peptidoglycan-associated protein
MLLRLKNIPKLLGILCTPLLWSQNLVLNPSFEEYTDCPKRLGNFNEDVAFWSTPTQGSTDYFNGCSKAMGTPKNFNGVQPADFGKGYTGMYLYAPDDYREYIQAELSEPLIKDVSYSISFYVSLAERSDYAIKEFGVVFSNQRLAIDIKKELSKMHLYKLRENVYTSMEIGYTNFFKDTQDWILVNTQFVAKGNEKFMTIGNFKSNTKTRKFKTKRDAKQGAYYYLDMVKLESVSKIPVVSKNIVEGVELTSETYELDKTHVFKNVLFEFDKFVLLESAKQDIKAIYKYLQTNDSLHININGHTDNIGTQGYNQQLSDQRCHAVANYLLELGLAKERLSWKGFGGINPIADNTSQDGRKKNRRVEFIITQSQK